MHLDMYISYMSDNSPFGLGKGCSRQDVTFKVAVVCNSVF